MQYPGSVDKHMQNVKQIRTDGQSRQIDVSSYIKNLRNVCAA